MVEIMNLSSTILILGSLYLHLVYGLSLYIVVVMIILACVSWVFVGMSDEREEYIKSQTKLNNSKAAWYSRR